MKQHTCIDCGQSPPSPSWHEVDDDQWVDTDCYRKRQARVLLADDNAALEIALAEMRAAFVKHRTATHKVTPMVCLTCQQLDAILAADSPTRGRALLEALRDQWESNHAEHCSNRPHEAGDEKCHWPMPAILATAAQEPRRE